jgi:hypothetical protein
MKRALLVLALLAWPGIAAADDAAFDAAAEMIPMDQRRVEAVQFDPTLPKIRLVAVSALSREPKLPPDEETYKKFYDEAGVYMAYPLDVKLKADQDFLVLRCDSGGSNDPQCVFSASQDPEQEGVAIPGLLFVMPGDGCVYSAGHTNTMFSARALHCLKDGKLQPVNQPFSYAGFRSKALRPLTLYADKQKSGIVTTIASGGFVEVVLQDGEFFLLRDGFGLTGWAALEQGQQATDIDGFFYNGD